MACWKTVDGQGYARQGSGFLFDIGAKGTYFALIEEQNDPYEQRVTIGRHTQESGRFPGPVYFQLDLSVVPWRGLRAFAVNDTGPEPVFYLGHHDPSNMFTFQVTKLDMNGNILAQFQGDTMEEPYTSIAVQDVVYMNDILVMTTTAQWHDGLESKLDTAYWVVGPDLAEGSVFIDAVWVGTFTDSLVTGHVHTKDRWMWQVVSTSGSTNEDGYSVYLWDDSWGFWDYIEIDWIPGGTLSHHIDIAIDCNGKDLIVSWTPPLDVNRVTKKYRFDVLESLGGDPESPYTYDDVVEDVEWCDHDGVLWSEGQYRISRDGKTLMTNSWFVGDGAGTEVHLLSCSPPTVTRYLRQRQRNDRKNAPRTGRANNQPTSLQHSVRSSRSGNFYMRERVPCGC